MPTVKQNKPKKSNKKPVDSVMPVIKKPKAKDVDKISVTRGITSAMKSTPQWAAHPELQTQVTTWNTAADALESNAKAITVLRTQVAGLETVQRSNRAAWSTARLQVTGTVKAVSEGSADIVHALGFDVRTQAAPALLPAPTGLLAVPGVVSGEAGFTWQRGNARRGFIVQHATDVANAATYSPLSPCAKAKYTLQNAPSGSVVHFRVAAQDSRAASEMSPWSDWCACTVG